MVKEGLGCACDSQHMGMTAELVAEKHGFTRQQQDAFAVESHRRAAGAAAEGRFADEILPRKEKGRRAQSAKRRRKRSA